MSLLRDVKKPCFVLHAICVCLIARAANSVVSIGHNDHYVNICDTCSVSTNEMLHQGNLLDILHTECPSSALTHSLGNELLNNQG